MIQINYLSFDVKRINFSFIALNILKQIRDDNKAKLKLKLFVTLWGDVNDNKNRWEEKYKELINEGINTEIFFYDMDPNDYMKKINQAVKSDCEYSCSMDEDVLIGANTWNYILDNLDYLNENQDTLFISPIISNGIPSVDLFVSDFIENDDIKNSLYSIFKNIHIPSMWGANFIKLNDHTINASIWNPENFYNEVNKVSHFYKGIHPVRISYEANFKLMEIITDNLDKIFKNQDYDLLKIKRPYYCNSFYFIKTETWSKIINDKSLFRDGFDEVPLNLYKDKNDMFMCFVKNGFCIHMSYNMIPNRYVIENKYVEKLNNYK